MRRMLAAMLLLSGWLGASEVVKEDGEVLKGEIVERVEGKFLRLTTADGKLYHFDWDELKSIDSAEVERRDAEERKPSAEPASFADQPWFAYWALGGAGAVYPADLQKYLESLKPSSRMTIGLDFLGFYWPVAGKKAVIGFVVNGVGDQAVYSQSTFLGDQSSAFTVNQYLYSFSTWYSPFGKVGDGLLLRADLGLASILSLYQGVFSTGSGYSGNTLSTGYGGLVGLGWAIGTSKGWRFIPNANYAVRSVAGKTYGSYALQAGLMW